MVFDKNFSRRLCEWHQMKYDVGRTLDVHPYGPVTERLCVLCNPPVKLSRSRRKHLWRKRRNLMARRRRTNPLPITDVYLCGEISRLTEILKNREEQR